jgi:hypothetical protein
MFSKETKTGSHAKRDRSTTASRSGGVSARMWRDGAVVLGCSGMWMLRSMTTKQMRETYLRGRWKRRSDAFAEARRSVAADASGEAAVEGHGRTLAQGRITHEPVSVPWFALGHNAPAWGSRRCVHAHHSVDQGGRLGAGVMTRGKHLLKRWAFQ